ncbi:putative MFS family arabinose efflux permease [Nocardiopsis sp. Huas11]|uniref:MFS transporter n=1 Tax=Nocardiopsis sp. Huas11 TaxID=2183912 RepID=UPI000EABE41F|nr:MFS transporter [Nocardiopsis sp. Huas11]RKS08574.1 putative MFS family arabinose efflux permease [Nocardiopsis sp. Huas11]
MTATALRGRGTLRELRGLGSLIWLLVGSQAAFNVGFFVVLPYLAAHLAGTIGLAGWLVGLVLGLRTFSQQGLFVVGGALTDRFGPRPVVLIGCVLRVAGFAWLAVAQRTGALIAAVLLIGFAAALFSPAVETEVARQAVRHERATGIPRTRVLGLFSTAGQAGTLVGPPLGALLLLGGFATACLAGAVVFTLVLIAHLRWMPRAGSDVGPQGGGEATPRERPRLGEGVRELLSHRPFLLLCLGYSGYLLAYNQLYLALPQEVERATGTQTALGWLLAWGSLLYVLVQMPVLRWIGDRLSRRAVLRTGLLLLATGFAAAAVLTPVTAAGGLLPSVAFVTALTLGQVLIVPTVRAWVPDLVDGARLGLFTGALSSASGLAVLLGSIPAGALVDRGGPASWLIMAAVPLAAAAFVPRAPRTA